MRSSISSSLALAFLIALAPGCYDLNVGAHDAGRRLECTADSDCTSGNQCVCGRCISLDLPAAACDPTCDVAQPGDFCTVEGRRCDADGCSALECRSGAMQRVGGDCDGGGPICACPPAPEGCYYDGSPCACDHITCPAERCGRVTCGEGTTCCNASCGTCAPLGTACSLEACMPDCSPQEARGDGTCERLLGIWAWDGTACRELSGCSGCVGSDCPHVFTSAAECQSTFSECTRFCGGFAGATCADDEYCDFPEPHWCGGADEQGVCAPRPAACDPELATVCGCDGSTYPNGCEAAANGVDVARDVACDEGPCTADDAHGVGECDLLLGNAWTGTGCVGISGCSCEGTDCDVIRRSDSACLDAHSHCIVPHT
ncbi:MAG: hypothetical protein M3Y87_08035 [Myxococcota bacterium]|nr:hypothetical protein [Myxococcota bacterium]